MESLWIFFWRRRPSVGHLGSFRGIILLQVVSEQKSLTPSWGLWNPWLPVSPSLPPVGRFSSSHRFTDGKTKNLMNPRSSHSLRFCWCWKVTVKREIKSPNLYHLHFQVLVSCKTPTTHLSQWWNYHICVGPTTSASHSSSRRSPERQMATKSLYSSE